MSGGGDTRVSDAERIRELYENRARAELAAADALCPGADTVAWRGALMAQVAVVKGSPGPAEAAGGAALSGADGPAITKALEALGWSEPSIFYTLSRPAAGLDPVRCAARLRAQVEAVDPIVVVALDSRAAEDLASALDVELAPAGEPTQASGRRIVALTAFEDSLADKQRKQVAWTQLQAARPPGPVF